jgi:hypothetical protein
MFGPASIASQPGYGSSEGVNQLSADAQFAKLELVCNTALATWGIEL